MVENETVRLNYRVSGIGHPVVFIHGFLESLSMWDYLEFEEDFTRICFDLPGHGKSPYNKESISSIHSMAELIKNELSELKVPDYSVVGHSMGGYVALELMKLDNCCTKLILLNSNFWDDDTQKKRDRIRLAEIVPKNKMLFLYEAIPNLFMHPENHHNEVKMIIDEAKNIPVEVIIECTLSMSNRLNNSEFVRGQRTNILIIQGKNDNLSTKEKMSEHNKVTGAKLVELEDCAHMAHIETTRQTVLAIQNFLEKKRKLLVSVVIKNPDKLGARE